MHGAIGATTTPRPRTQEPVLHVEQAHLLGPHAGKPRPDRATSPRYKCAIDTLLRQRAGAGWRVGCRSWPGARQPSSERSTCPARGLPVSKRAM